MRLLIIGSLEGHITTASKIAMSRGAKVAHVDGIEAALATLRAGRGADLAMIDVRLDVRRLVDALARERFSVPVVACGIGTDADAAVKAIKGGAQEYIPLPPDAELISAVLEAASEDSLAIIGQGSGLSAVFRLADKVAQSDANVLITGETGTGKELLARYLHRKSRRAKHDLISVNCAAIPDNLLESEMFGHEKGAFTGAIARRIGKFEEADGGSLLLDEISEMPSRLQAKLLRAIQEREIDRLGSNRPIKVNIRVIATSNQDLKQEAAAGNFREDLYYRLNVVNLHLPPLRDRPSDLPLLAEHFVRKYSDSNGLPERPISEAGLRTLLAHRWPGNVRELENAMHRAVLLATGEEIDPSAILLGDGIAPITQGAAAVAALSGNGVMVGGPNASADEGGFMGRTVAEVEREVILDTLHHCLGNRTHAANILGISIRTLRNKLKLYAGDGVHVPPPAGDFERGRLTNATG
ncbi:MAG: sigma-54 dependent transcriptional regulator [Kiloniellales bacterium]